MTPSLLLLLRRPGPVISLLVHGAAVATAFLAAPPTIAVPPSSFHGGAAFDAVPIDVATAALDAPAAPDVELPESEPPESVEPRTTEEVVIEDVVEAAAAPDDAGIRIAADVAVRPLPVARRRGAVEGPAGPVGAPASASHGTAYAFASRGGGVTGNARGWASNRGPTYPEAERLRGIEGVALLRFVVHPDGSVEVSLERSSGSDALDEAALEAARSWRFAPALVDGVPTTDTFIKPFRFFLR